MFVPAGAAAAAGQRAAAAVAVTAAAATAAVAAAIAAAAASTSAGCVLPAQLKIFAVLPALQCRSKMRAQCCARAAGSQLAPSVL